MPIVLKQTFEGFSIPVPIQTAQFGNRVAFAIDCEIYRRTTQNSPRILENPVYTAKRRMQQTPSHTHTHARTPAHQATAWPCVRLV